MSEADRPLGEAKMLSLAVVQLVISALDRSGLLAARPAAEAMKKAEKVADQLAEKLLVHALSRRPPSRPHSGWVAVGERLPGDKNELVFVSADGSIPIYANLDGVDEDGRARWWLVDHEMEVNWTYGITHWMPLPAPPEPRAEGKED